MLYSTARYYCNIVHYSNRVEYALLTRAVEFQISFRSEILIINRRNNLKSYCSNEKSTLLLYETFQFSYYEWSSAILVYSSITLYGVGNIS